MSRIPITPELLKAAMGCTARAAKLHASHLDRTCEHYQIGTVMTLAAYLAQLGHESGSLRHVREIWGPTPAQLRYEGRADLGNTEPGDGHRFMGRSWIQRTGRANYRTLTQRLRAMPPGLFTRPVPDFEADPEAVADPEWSAWSSADFWDEHGLNPLAEAGDFRRVTRIINGGFNGMADRMRRYDRALEVLRTWSHVEPPAPAPKPASGDYAGSAAGAIAGAAVGAGAVAYHHDSYVMFAVAVVVVLAAIAAFVYLNRRDDDDHDD